MGKGAFEKFASSLFDDAFEAIKADLEGKSFKSKFQKGTFDKIWYKYRCLETHAYIWHAQDIHNGKHYSFEAGKEYDFSEAPRNLAYIVQHPDKYEFIEEWIQEDPGRDFKKKDPK